MLSGSGANVQEIYFGQGCLFSCLSEKVLSALVSFPNAFGIRNNGYYWAGSNKHLTALIRYVPLLRSLPAVGREGIGVVVTALIRLVPLLQGEPVPKAFGRIGVVE